MNEAPEIVTEAEPAESAERSWERELREWWDGLTAERRAAWLADKPHIPFVAVSRDGYWGRGQTQEEAIKQMRAAGFRGKLAGKAALYVMPATLLDGGIDYTGAVTYYYHPEKACRTDRPQRITL